MSSSEDKVESGDFDTFVSALVVNVGLLVVVIVIFWILKSFKSNKFFFAPQYYDR